MQTHHRSSAILISVLMIPFGIAIYQDANADGDPYADADDVLAALDHDYYKESNYHESDYPGSEDFAYPEPSYVDPYGDDLQEDDGYPADDVPAAPQVPSMGTSFFDDILFDGGKSKSPVVGGFFRGIAFGDKVESVLANKPSFEDWMVELPGYPEATASLAFEGEVLQSIYLRFPDDGSALRSLKTQWGTPSFDNIDQWYGGVAMWQNASARLQAQLNTGNGDGYASVLLSPYQELSDLIAPKAKLFGFESSDLLELHGDELEQLLSESAGGDIILSRPAIANSIAPVQILLATENQRVVSITVDLDLDMSTGAELLRALGKKFGKPVSTSGDEWGKVYVFKKHSRVITLKTDEHGYNSLFVVRA